MEKFSVVIDGEGLRITNLETGQCVWAVRCNDERSLWMLIGQVWGPWRGRYPTFEALWDDVTDVAA